MIIAGHNNKARDVGKHPGPRVISRTMPDGSVTTENLPRTPFMEFINLQGTAVNEPLHNGGGNDGEEETYRLYIERNARKRGFIPAAVCPQMEGVDVKRRLPASIQGRQPCTETTTGKRPNDRGRFPYGHYCQCIVDLIAHRRGIHLKTESTRRSSVELAAELNRKVAASQIDASHALVAAVERLAEAQSKAKAPAKAKPDTESP